VYQGEEIGMADGPGADPPIDRAGRDGARHPMQWDPSPNGGFTEGRPWLPVVDPAEHNVADQREDRGSLLSFYRDLIALRPELGEGFELVDAADGVLAYRRGDHLVAINLTGEEREAPEGAGRLAPHAGIVAHGVRVVICSEG
jgi:alpha-glucosidase